MINKIKIFAAVFLAILAAYFAFRYNLAQNEITALKNENNAIKSENKNLKDDVKHLQNAVEAQKEEVKKHNESQVQASRQIADLRKAAKNIKTSCNCYNLFIDDVFINKLPKP